MMKTTSLLALAAGGLLTAVVLGGCEQRRDSATVTTDIRNALSRQQLPNTITVAVAGDGTATLGGTVRDEATRDKAEDVAEDVHGVRQVTNNIRVATAAGDAPAVPRVAPQYNLPESGVPPSGAGNAPAARPGMNDPATR